MHFVRIELSRNSLLLINNPSKRGDVENFGVILGFPATLSKKWHLGVTLSPFLTEEVCWLNDEFLIMLVWVLV